MIQALDTNAEIGVETPLTAGNVPHFMDKIVWFIYQHVIQYFGKKFCVKERFM